ncbi:hypothetical protein PAXRUDRAFT_825833 [Paxillus rubicundulus Ve08.2h10]|uniref:Uncharacterized protein n=1 Tax=Paxillus rubicundulus Ve08.2h10 TaxID=930991 RepID=A0A0D0DSP0_9AGAM|nr:hypothetical protein PAXRUDRAFT_825833 [Paxillus rubicundulus Ve08.2h10]
MGCVQSSAREESRKLSVKTSKSWASRQKEKQELKKAGKWPASPEAEDPAPWVGGHRTLQAVLKDGQCLVVQGDTTSNAQ